MKKLLAIISAFVTGGLAVLTATFSTICICNYTIKERNQPILLFFMYVFISPSFYQTILWKSRLLSLSTLLPHQINVHFWNNYKVFMHCIF